MRFPGLQQNLQQILSNEMDKICHEETFLKEEPERLDIALKRCKKLTGTLVTLKRWVNEISNLISIEHENESVTRYST